MTTETPVPSNSLSTNPDQLHDQPGKISFFRMLPGRIATRRPSGFTRLAAASTCALARPSLNGGFITTLSKRRLVDSAHWMKSACSTDRPFASSTRQCRDFHALGLVCRHHHGKVSGAGTRLQARIAMLNIGFGNGPLSQRFRGRVKLVRLMIRNTPGCDNLAQHPGGVIVELPDVDIFIWARFDQHTTDGFQYFRRLAPDRFVFVAQSNRRLYGLVVRGCVGSSQRLR